MNFEQMKKAIEITGVEPLQINGEVLSADFVKSTIYARIWRSALVVKNKREADKGGIKLVVGQALNAGLITAEEGLTILLTGDKNRVAELKSQLPTTEKTEEPTETDIATAVSQVLANKGQAS